MDRRARLGETDRVGERGDARRDLHDIGAEVPERIERMIADGALGRKSGRGFYTYDR